VLLRLSEDRFWLALADSDVLLWAKGLAHGLGMQVELAELRVAPIQIQGPKSKQVMQALLGEQVLGLKYYHFIQTAVQGMPVIVTRTGWSGEVGYEIYLLRATRQCLVESVMEREALQPGAHRPSDIRRIRPHSATRISLGQSLEVGLVDGRPGPGCRFHGKMRWPDRPGPGANWWGRDRERPSSHDQWPVSAAGAPWDESPRPSTPA
jgi:hypothetical protein